MLNRESIDVSNDDYTKVLISGIKVFSRAPSFITQTVLRRCKFPASIPKTNWLIFIPRGNSCAYLRQHTRNDVTNHSTLIGSRHS